MQNIESQLCPEMLQAIARDAENTADIVCEGLQDIDAVRRRYNKARPYWNEAGPVMAKTLQITVNNAGFEVPCELHYPTTLNPQQTHHPTLVFMHGGGWVMGNLQTHHRLMREIAHRSRHIVVGVDYRLSPETRFPDSYQDAQAVLEQLLEQGARYHIDAQSISVGGDSAGAHMALYCALAERHSARPAIRALVLIYGSFGLQDSVSRRLYSDNIAGVTEADMHFYFNALMGEDNPTVSQFDLLRQDLLGLPPSIITGCLLDPLRDDSRALALLLTEAGVVNELHEYAGVLHGYVNLAAHVPQAVDTLQLCAKWLINNQ